MARATSTRLRLHNKKIASAVREAAMYAAVRERVLEEHIAKDPSTRIELERLNSMGLDPMAWLNILSVPGLLKIDEKTASGKLLAEVFRQCELDHHKPRHWRILLNTLVEQCFRGPGAPPKWDEGGLVELLEDIRTIQKRFPGKKSKTELARLLTTQKPFKSKYQKLTTDFPGFRKVIGRALDPKTNPAVNVPEGEDWIAFRAERAAQEYGLQTQIGIDAQIATQEKMMIEELRVRFFEKFKDDPAVEAEWQRILPEARELARKEVKRISNFQIGPAGS